MRPTGAEVRRRRRSAGAGRPSRQLASKLGVALSLATLNQALRDRDADRAWEISCALPHVPMRFAIRLVVLLAETPGRRDRYKIAARRFAARALTELDPERAPLEQIKRLVDALAHVHHHYWQHQAIAALHDVVGQMHERDVRLGVEFDSEGEGRRWR